MNRMNIEILPLRVDIVIWDIYIFIYNIIHIIYIIYILRSAALHSLRQRGQYLLMSIHRLYMRVCTISCVTKTPCFLF